MITSRQNRLLTQKQTTTEMCGDCDTQSKRKTELNIRQHSVGVGPGKGYMNPSET